MIRHRCLILQCSEKRNCRLPNTTTRAVITLSSTKFPSSGGQTTPSRLVHAARPLLRKRSSMTSGHGVPCPFHRSSSSRRNHHLLTPCLTRLRAIQQRRLRKRSTMASSHEAPRPFHRSSSTSRSRSSNHQLLTPCPTGPRAV